MRSRSRSRAQLLVLPLRRIDAFDLLDLELEQVELALARSGEPLGALERLARVAHRFPGQRARRAQAGAVLAAPAVEDLELRGAQHQPAVLVLAVEGEHRRREVAQLGDRDRAAAEVGARAAVGSDPPGEHELARVGGELLVLEPFRELEDALDVGLGRSGPHDSGSGATAQQQVEGTGEHRLARSRLPRDHVQTRRELEARVFDQQQVLDGQLEQHAAHGLPANGDGTRSPSREHARRGAQRASFPNFSRSRR